MYLECPHCQANYDIAQDVGDAVFVCHQCGQEFSAPTDPIDGGQPEPDSVQAWRALQWQPVSRGFAMPPWQGVDIFAPSPESQDLTAPELVEEEPAALEVEPAAVESEQAPVRKTAHIWPWMLTILILLAGSGFWVQKDAWLDNRQFRSALINIGFDMPLRARDWRIDPASVQPEWITRDDGGRMLRIRGDIKNLLDSDMPLPKIKMIFFSKTEPDKQIGQTVLAITLTPSDQQMQHMVPARDLRPVSALGNRSFTIVAESVPEKTGDFTLTPAPH